MGLWWEDKDTRPRYEKQLENVEYLVLNTIQDKKGININLKELRLILDALYEWRIVE